MRRVLVVVAGAFAAALLSLVVDASSAAAAGSTGATLAGDPSAPVLRLTNTGDRACLVLAEAEGTVALQAGSVLDTERLTALLGHLTPRERAAARRGLALLARAAKRLREPGAVRRRKSS